VTPALSLLPEAPAEGGQGLGDRAQFVA
jgi:hypothetical protein